MDDSLEDFLETAENVWKQLKAIRNDEEEVLEEEKEVSAELKQIGNITGRLEDRDLGQLTEEVIELKKQ